MIALGRSSGKPHELEDKVISFILDGSFSIERTQRGKPLARRTAGQQAEFSGLDFQFVHDLLYAQVTNISLPDPFHICVILFIRLHRHSVDFNGTDNLVASTL